MTTTPTEPQASQSGGPAGNASRRSWVWGAMSWTTLITFVVIFAVDQAHKWWMLLVFNLEERGRVAITSFMDVIFVLNTGISYSLLDGDSQSWQYTLAAFAVLVSAAMWIWAAREAKGWLFAAAIGLIIGGALGNALDRVLVGGVIDYVSLHAYGYRWYIFNIADVAIVAGVIGLLYDSLWLSRNSATNTP